MSLLYPTENPTEYIISNCGKFGTDEIVGEIVRCKDCINYGDDYKSGDYCYLLERCVDKYDYCSWAEGKDWDK